MLQRGLAAAVLAAALTSAYLVAGYAAENSDNASTDAAQIEKGRLLYGQRCSHCHGLNMVTAGNTTFDLREFPRDQTERFFESVTNGKNNRMPPWGDVISQEDIGDIWAYVRSRSKS